MLIFPSVESATSKTVEEIGKYLENGGKIILTGSSLKTDEYGHAQDYLTFLQSKAPQSSIYVRSKSMAETYRYFFEPILNELNINRPVRIDIGEGKLPWGIVMRCITKEGKTFVNVVNYLNETQTISLRKQGKLISQALDLLSGESIKFPLEIEPLHPYLLEIPE